MYRIGKRFRFEAAHSLPRLPDGHKCKRDHGHSYQVAVILEAPKLNAFDFVVDYGDLDWFKMLIDERYDHRNLNEVFDEIYGVGEVMTTAENLARHFYEIVAPAYTKLARVTVRVNETVNTFAEYTDG